MTFAWRLASRSAKCLPLAAGATFLSHVRDDHGSTLKCESSEPGSVAPPSDASIPPLNGKTNQGDPVKSSFGMQPDATGSYHGLFPLRQKWEPKLEYPLWDHNWDGRVPPTTGDEEEDKRRMREIRKTGVTRHIILVRHGQYDESHKEDEMRKLTPLGRTQAELTGKRLASMMQGSAGGGFAPCPIKVLRVSGMTRAIETADIISSYLPGVHYEKPDPQLNEGRPCHHIPTGKASEKMVKATDESHGRIEEAFQRYFHRADRTADGGGTDDGSSDTEEKHEFEVIVCHANVIRYFLCRALQLPPEAWLRYCPFNCSLTYITIRPTGSVSCRMIGDTGHLPYDLSSFSQHHGFVW